MPIAHHEIVVIGGGIAGLSAAWRLRQHDLLLLEAGERFGGRVYSVPRGEYWLNFGAHLFGDDTTPAGALVKELGLELRAIPGDRMGIAFKGRIVAGGRSETYPLRLPLSLSARLSFAKMGLRLRSGSLRLLTHQRHVPGESPEARRVRLLNFDNQRTLADYVGPLAPDTDLILRTITERTSAAPEAMGAGYGLTSFTQVWSKHSFGRNLFGGSERLVQAITSALGNRALSSAECLSVVQHPNHVDISYGHGSEEHRVRARHVIVATQANVARAIIRGLPPETDSALAAVRYGPFLSAAVLTGESGAMPWDGHYAIATPGLSFGVLFNQASTLRTGSRKPGGSLMLFRGAEGAASLMALSDSEIEGRFLADLETLYPGSRAVVREIAIQRWPQGAPYSYPGRGALQGALTRPLGRVHLAGDYLEFPCMDAAIATANEAADRVATALIEPDT